MVEICILILTFIWIRPRLRMGRPALKKNKVGGLKLHDYKIYCKAIQRRRYVGIKIAKLS